MKHLIFSITILSAIAAPSKAQATTPTPTPARQRPVLVQSPTPASGITRPAPRPTRPPSSTSAPQRPGPTSLSTAPAAPERTNSTLAAEKTKEPAKPVILGVDLSIQKATQTSGDFWIVRIRNSGAAEAPPSVLDVHYVTNYKSGNFPNGTVGSYSFPTPTIKPGGVTDINVKTSQRTKPEIEAHFEVNANHAIKELNYTNNKKTVPANPAY